MSKTETALAVPDEELDTVIQMTKLADLTVRPGLMRLPVKKVTTAKNSPQVVIILEHPVEDDIRKYYDKPKMWTRHSELRRLLDAYGYTERNMHALQTEHMYVTHDGEEWEIVPPPSKIRKRARRWRKAASHQMPRRLNAVIGILVRRMWLVRESLPSKNHFRLVQMTVLGTLLGMVLAILTGFTSIVGAAVIIVWAFLGLVVGGVVFAP